MEISIYFSEVFPSPAAWRFWKQLISGGEKDEFPPVTVHCKYHRIVNTDFCVCKRSKGKMSLALLIPAVHFMNFMTIKPAFYPLLKSRIFVKLSMKKLGILHTRQNSQLQDPDSTKIERIKISAGFHSIHNSQGLRMWIPLVIACNDWSYLFIYLKFIYYIYITCYTIY